MIVARLKEAAHTATQVSGNSSFNVILSLHTEGIITRASDAHRGRAHITSWADLEQSVINPLLHAIKIVSEAFPVETIDGEG